MCIWWQAELYRQIWLKGGERSKFTEITIFLKTLAHINLFYILFVQNILFKMKTVKITQFRMKIQAEKDKRQGKWGDRALGFHIANNSYVLHNIMYHVTVKSIPVYSMMLTIFIPRHETIVSYLL